MFSHKLRRGPGGPAHLSIKWINVLVSAFSDCKFRNFDKEVTTNNRSTSSLHKEMITCAHLDS